MVLVTTLADPAAEPFVSLTTYRRSGEGVATAVWTAPDGDGLLVWTSADSGKVKRLRHDPRVDLAPCSRTGRVAPDAPHVTATATVDSDRAHVRSAQRALAAEYGLQYRAIATVEALVGRLRRRPPQRVVLRIS